MSTRVSFSGYEIGRQLGQAMARPVNPLPTMSFVTKWNQMQKQVHLRMLQNIEKDLAVVKPDGILPKDLPYLYDKYNKYKELAMENLDVLNNPKKNINKYNEILQARADLMSSLARYKDAARQWQNLSRQIISFEGKDRMLSPEADKLWEEFTNKPTDEFIKEHPGGLDEKDLFIDMTPSPQQAASLYKNMLQIVKTGSLRIPVQTDGGRTITDYEVPSVPHLAEASSLMYNYLPEEEKNKYEELAKSVTPKDISSMKDELKKMYKAVPEDVLGVDVDKFIPDSNITGKDLFVYNNLISSAPKPVGKPTANPAYVLMQKEMKDAEDRIYREESLRLRKMGLDLQKDREARLQFEGYLKDIKSEVENQVKKIKNQYGQDYLIPEDVMNDIIRNARDGVIKIRKKAGQWVPTDTKSASQSPINTGKSPFDSPDQLPEDTKTKVYRQLLWGQH